MGEERARLVFAGRHPQPAMRPAAPAPSRAGDSLASPVVKVPETPDRLIEVEVQAVAALPTA
jgi:hypothetical protein